MRGQGVREPRECVLVAGGLQQGHRARHSVPGDCKGGGGRPGGGGQGVREPRHLPHALERVRQSSRLLRSTTCDGNIAEAWTRAFRRSAQPWHRCRPSPFVSGRFGRALLLVLTKLLDRIVDRRHRCVWMIECVRQSGSRLPWMVVIHFQTCTWRTSPFMRAKRTLRWHISNSTSRGASSSLNLTDTCSISEVAL